MTALAHVEKRLLAAGVPVTWVRAGWPWVALDCEATPQQVLTAMTLLADWLGGRLGDPDPRRRRC